MPRNTKNVPNFIHVVQHDITTPSALILGRVRSKEWAGGAQLEPASASVTCMVVKSIRGSQTPDALT